MVNFMARRNTRNMGMAPFGSSMTRGRFLRNAGITAAGLGAAAVGLGGTAHAKGGGGAQILRSPYVNPFYLITWYDNKTDLSVAVAYYESDGWPVPGGFPTLDAALSVFLPESAHAFTPYFPNAAVNWHGDEVPVAVYNAGEQEVLTAYVTANFDFLEEHLVAAGFVSAMMVGRVGAALQMNAVGKVELIEGGTATLTAMTLEQELGQYRISKVKLR